MVTPTLQPTFEEVVLPHLDSAYNLARWLTRNEHDAEGVVQEACLRAYRYFPSFNGDRARAWLLTVVRNSCYNWMDAARPIKNSVEFDETLFTPSVREPDPEQVLLQNDDAGLVRKALNNLSPNFREVLVLRELEDLSYKEISAITGMPMGTVMSTLSRARHQLRQALTALTNPNEPALTGQPQGRGSPSDASI
jgi:RNA polymerase sigma-70 factor (ECF subfamily)